MLIRPASYYSLHFLLSLMLYLLSPLKSTCLSPSFVSPLTFFLWPLDLTRSPSHSSTPLGHLPLSPRRHLTTLNTHSSHSEKRGTDRNSDVVAPLSATAPHEDETSQMYAPTSINLSLP
jgi:hypothetical protein